MMRTLTQLLQDEDTGRLHILAEMWGFDLPHASMRELLPSVVAHLSDPANSTEIYLGLPEEEQQILHTLQAAGNRIPVAELQRRFGEIRRFGAGRRDREKPWRTPVSPLEALWYLGWVGTAFDHTRTGLQEFFFIPLELLPALPAVQSNGVQHLGSPAETPQSIFPASPYLLEDCTTMLADLRRHTEQDIPGYLESSAPDQFLIKPKSRPFLLHLLNEMDIISGTNLLPDPQALRSWFETTQAVQQQHCILCWRDSRSWNDLALVPTLTCPGGNWPNDPLESRAAVLAMLAELPLDTWWDLSAFVQAVREKEPAFQRPAGDFDSWYLQSTSDGAFLSGFQSWDAVEGSLIRTMLRGPLYWLGLVDLGKSGSENWITSFRKTQRFNQLAGDPPLPGAAPHAEPLYAVSGEIHFPLHADPTLRYQIARAAQWAGFDGKSHRYYLTPHSLQQAAGQGLSAAQLLALLRSQDPAPPPYLETAIRQWEESRKQSGVRQVYLLQVDSAAVLTRLKQDRSTSAFLGEQLSPTSALIRRTDLRKLYSAALRLGILLNIPSDGESAGA